METIWQECDKAQCLRCCFKLSGISTLRDKAAANHGQGPSTSLCMRLGMRHRLDDFWLPGNATDSTMSDSNMIPRRTAYARYAQAKYKNIAHSIVDWILALVLDAQCPNKIRCDSAMQSKCKMLGVIPVNPYRASNIKRLLCC